MSFELSILIPARNEVFLARTVQDILENSSDKTEVIVGLDGLWANPPIAQHPRVTVLYYPRSIGQRAMTNQLCRLSKAKYVAKTDAHCSFAKGFDEVLIADMQDDYTMIPVMKNLHVFDWVCSKCGNKWYQGKTPEFCYKDYRATKRNEICDSTSFEKEMKWIAKSSPNSRFFRFDNTLHFQYWNALGEREGFQGDLAESMSIQGSFFMLTRDKYWELNICDEAHGSWGQQGVEVSCKTWLSDGKIISNKKTWYAHLFRTQGGDFGFPYPNNTVTQARKYSNDFWRCSLEELQKKWKPAKHDLNWLLEKFAPVPDWDITKGIVYYTDSRLEDTLIASMVRNQISKACGSKRIVSVSLAKLDWGDNIVLPLQRGYLTMAKQILAGLKEQTADIIFFCEHDVLYHPSHFEFVPPRRDTFYYNNNVWKVRMEDGHAMRVDDMKQLSGICAYRDLLIQHYEKKVSLLEAKMKEVGEGEEFNKYVREVGFEPATHGRIPELVGMAESWEAEHPNIDIRHDNTLTPSRWSPDQFRNKKYTEGWQESDIIPSWGKFADLI